MRGSKERIPLNGVSVFDERLAGFALGSEAVAACEKLLAAARGSLAACAQAGDCRECNGEKKGGTRPAACM